MAEGRLDDADACMNATPREYLSFACSSFSPNLALLSYADPEKKAAVVERVALFCAARMLSDNTSSLAAVDAYLSLATQCASVVSKECEPYLKILRSTLPCAEKKLSNIPCGASKASAILFKIANAGDESLVVEWLRVWARSGQSKTVMFHFVDEIIFPNRDCVVRMNFSEFFKDGKDGRSLSGTLVSLGMLDAASEAERLGFSSPSSEEKALWLDGLGRCWNISDLPALRDFVASSWTRREERKLFNEIIPDAAERRRSRIL